MTRLTGAATLAAFLLAGRLGAAIEMTRLADMPIEHGRAAAFVGIAEGGVVFAGGTNFPEGPPWQGGAKAWHDEVRFLQHPEGKWERIGRLPRPIGHGTQASTGRGVLCIGGADGERHYADVFLLRRRGQLVTREQLLAFEELTPLPHPLAYAAAARIGEKVHVIGGTVRPDATQASAELLVFDLADPGRGWESLEPIPAPGRILPVVAAHDGELFVFSGASLAPGPDGKPARTYLRDAWSYRPGKGWRRLADLPRAAVAAPSPAPVLDGGRILVIGGDDGTRVGFQPPASHPGFARDILRYDTATDTWAEAASIPTDARAPVVTTAVDWKGAWLIPGGEQRPAVRTTQVLALRETRAEPPLSGAEWTLLAAALAVLVAIGGHLLRRRWASGEG